MGIPYGTQYPAVRYDYRNSVGSAQRFILKELQYVLHLAWDIDTLVLQSPITQRHGYGGNSLVEPRYAATVPD